MSGCVLTQSPSNQFIPSSFNSSYGEAHLAATPGPNDQARLPTPSLGSTNEHLPLPQQETAQEGDTANSITLSGREHQDGRGDVEAGTQFVMDDDSDGSGEVRPKTPPPLYGVVNPVARQSSTTDTDSTITVNFASPIEERDAVVYRQRAEMHFSRNKLCRKICRLRDARPLEKTIYIEINKSKVEVELHFMPYCTCKPESHGKVVTLQAYFKMPSSRKSRRRIENVVNGYRHCNARLVGTVYDPQANAVIAEKISEPKRFILDKNSYSATLVYVEIEELVHHNSIIYGTSMHLVFKVEAEIICNGKITSTSAGEVVFVNY